MSNVTSQDGTNIAYEKLGDGPTLILVDGAMCYRGFGPMPSLAELLQSDFSVYMYDRRGRGESEDTAPFTPEREIEDIAALIEAVGGSANVYGISSGAALALRAAASGLNITRLAIYEPPFNNDQQAQQDWATYRTNLDQLIAQDRRSDAAALFMQQVGTPPEAIEGMKHAPMWASFEAVAPTLAYDGAVLGDMSVPVEEAEKLTMPVLAMVGGETMAFMAPTAKAIANAAPRGEFRTIAGQTHDIQANVIAPILKEFFL